MAICRWNQSDISLFHSDTMTVFPSIIFKKTLLFTIMLSVFNNFAQNNKNNMNLISILKLITGVMTIF